MTKRSRRQLGPFIKRGSRNENQCRHAFAPPEDWYEPQGNHDLKYRIVVQSPGSGYRHVVTPEEIRGRLSLFPGNLLAPLEVIQLSEMTRKKRQFPCYGMQWGSALYLYPIEESLVEYFSRPPRPAQRTEACMYGGKWFEESAGHWKLVWTEKTIKDFYLNNVLLHELGHLLDERNTSYVDRERFAEWFALQFGYKSKHHKGLANRRMKKRVRRRHHSKG